MRGVAFLLMAAVTDSTSSLDVAHRRKRRVKDSGEPPIVGRSWRQPT